MIWTRLVCELSLGNAIPLISSSGNTEFCETLSCKPIRRLHCLICHGPTLFDLGNLISMKMNRLQVSYEHASFLSLLFWNLYLLEQTFIGAHAGERGVW